jgi:hypothetical protein
MGDAAVSVVQQQLAAKTKVLHSHSMAAGASR